MSESSKPSLKSTSASIDPRAHSSAEASALPGRDEVKGKFVAGAVPLEADYATHIDATYTALAAVGLDPDSATTGQGLQLNTATNKLEVNTATIQAKLTATDGVQLNTNTLSAKLHTASTNHIAGVIRADTAGLFIDTGNGSTRKGLLAQPADANRSVLGLALNTSHCMLDNTGYLGINTANVQLKLSAAKPLTLTGATVGLGLRTYGALHTDAAYANILALKPTTANELTLYANTQHFTLTTAHTVPTLQINTANIQPKLTAGSGITINTSNNIAVNTTVIQPKLTAGSGITINSANNNIAVNLAAGTGISISSNSISVKAGTGITVDTSGVSVNMAAVIPRGVITMFSGTSAPTGWAFCNGQNGTPDLRSKFIKGSTSFTSSTGGSNTKSYTPSGTVSVANHTLTVAQIPAHSHGVTGNHPNSNGWWAPNMGLGAVTQDGTKSNIISPTGGGGAHNHGASFSGTTANIDVQPAFYAIAFIMKL
jgi:microcystin-dependent protein